jgi:tetratricopeptide (TPR) repeat protein
MVFYMTQKKSKISCDSDIIKTVNISLDLLKKGNLEESLDLFEEILKSNFSNSIAETGIKCCKYWIPRISRFNLLKKDSEKGRLYFEEWKKFETFIYSIKNIQKKVISNLMFYIFSKALDSFKDDLNANKVYDFNTFFMIALLYKKIGDYGNALKYFDEIINFEKGNSNVIALLADCYALIDELKKAKVLFREAFYIDPVSIDMNLLESGMIKSLISIIEERKIDKNEINYWLPVYGRVLDFFNIYRELLPVEIGRLKQEIFQLKKVYLEKSDGIAKARLLNCLLMIYDDVKYRDFNKNKMDDIELEIKDVSDEIYDLLKNKTILGKMNSLFQE